MTRKQPHRIQADGYTFVELAMVLMVLGIVAALAVPMLGGTANSRLAAAARLLAADIDHARVASITRADRPTVVVFDGDGGGYHLAYNDDLDEPIDHPIDHHPYRVRFGEGKGSRFAGVTIGPLDFADAPVLAFGRFGELSQPDEAGMDEAIITLTAAGRSVQLTIDPTAGEVAIGDLN